MTTWLVDKSAYVRLATSPDARAWAERRDRGLLHVATVTRLEIGYSMRGARDLEEELDELARYLPVHAPPRAEDRAIEVQQLLTTRGQHRAPSIADLLVAATAEVLGHTVLHVNKDFDVIAEINYQPLERLSQ